MGMKTTFSVIALLLTAAAAFAGDQVAAQAYVETPQNSKNVIGSCANPIVIQAFNETGGMQAERAYLDGRFKDHTPVSQSRTTCKGKAAYRVKFRMPDGKKHVLFFDASGWAGKR